MSLSILDPKNNVIWFVSINDDMEESFSSYERAVTRVTELQTIGFPKAHLLVPYHSSCDTYIWSNIARPEERGLASCICSSWRDMPNTPRELRGVI